eukprot:scaffold3341_cov317-Prasinococcus_capsulatus_cf.AAC.1
MCAPNLCTPLRARRLAPERPMQWARCPSAADEWQRPAWRAASDPVQERTPEEQREERRRVRNGTKYEDDEKITLTFVSELVGGRMHPLLPSRARVVTRCACGARGAAQHQPHEYGIERTAEGGHTGGPFRIAVSPRMKVGEFKNLLRDACGILPGLMNLSFRGACMRDCVRGTTGAAYAARWVPRAGTKLADNERRLEQYGVAYWHKLFPDWPIVLTRQG